MRVEMAMLYQLNSALPITEIVRAFTYVINQGWAMYWGTSRWSATEIMVSEGDDKQTSELNIQSSLY